MRRHAKSLLLLAIAASCLMLGALAQEGEWEQQQPQAGQSVEALEAELAAKSVEAQRRLDEAQMYYEQSVAADTRAKQLESQLHEERSATASRVAELEAKLEAARASSSKSGFDATAMLNSARSLVMDGSKATIEEAQAIFEDLKAGNTSRLGLLAFKLYSHAEGAVTKASSFAAQKFDDHVPESAKRSIGGAITTGQDLWKTHAVESEWSQKVRSTVGEYHGQLKDVIHGTLDKNPSTQKFADPSIVSIVATSVMVLPVFLILLPLLCGGKKKKPVVRMDGFPA